MPSTLNIAAKIGTDNPIFAPLITSLETAGASAGNVDAFIQAVVNLINNGYIPSNPALLVEQINHLANNGWNVNLPTPPVLSAGQTDTPSKLIQIVVNPTTLTAPGAALAFVGTLAYEIGHAEDPQQNTMEYVDDLKHHAYNALAVGAQVAEEFISEAKSLYNQLTASAESILISNPSGTPQARSDEQAYPSDHTKEILLGAADLANDPDAQSTISHENALTYYWNAELRGSGLTSSNTNPGVLGDMDSMVMSGANLASSNGISFSQVTAGGPITMAITFADSGSDNGIVEFNGSDTTVSSYIITFNGYGPIFPTGITGGQGAPQLTNGATGSATAYQAFNFAAGGYTVDAYNVNGATEEIFNYSTGSFNPSTWTPSTTSDLISTTSYFTNNTIVTQVFATASLAMDVSEIDTDYASPTATITGTKFDFSDTNSITLDAGTAGTTSYSDTSSVVNVPLMLGGNPLATLTFDTSANTDSISLNDGMTITLPGISGSMEITAASAGTSPLDTLAHYLDNLGYTSDLDTANLAYLYPSGLPSQSSTLNLNSHSGVVSQSEFNAFTSISGNGTITAATSGTFDLATAPVTGGSQNLEASDWLGTTLIGNGENSQLLTASLLGNDYLYAGNGTGDTLFAGMGVDTLVGGTGGDTFKALSGLAAGSSVTGNGTGNTLVADQDISGASVSGIQTLDVGNATSGDNQISLTAAEFSGFSTINFSGQSSVGSITAASGGTYDLTGKTVTVASPDTYYSINAVSGGSTTIMGNDTSGGLTSNFLASGSGNDTLEAGGASGDELSATGNGNDTLSTGNGSGDTLSASGNGNDSLTAGTGASDILSASGSGTNTLTAGSGNDDSLTATGTGTNTLIAGNGNDDTLTASNGIDSLTAGTGAGDTLSVTTGGNTLTAGNGSGDIFNVQGGDNTISAGNGGDTFNINDDDNSVTATGGSNTFNLLGSTVSGADGGDIDLSGSSLDGGSGGTNTLTANGENLDISGATVSNIQIIDDADALTLTATQLSDLTSIDVTTLDAATSGSYSLSGLTTAKVDMNDDSAAGGVTLIGNNANDETLTAGTVGGDTLESGSGNGDELIAGTGNNTLEAGSGTGDALIVSGTGVETLEGGSGGDTFVASNGLAPGSSVAGTGSGNTLIATGDISGATITGVQTLDLEGSVLLTSTEYAEFASVDATDGSYTIVDASLTAAAAAALAGTTGYPAVAVIDTAANVQTNINALQTLAGDSELASITFTDASAPTLTLTSTQLADDSGAIAAIGGTYTISVTGVTAADAATVAAETNVIAVAVSDTAANVTSNISSLETLAASGELVSIAFTDSGAPSLSFSATDAAADIDAISAFTGSFTLTVSDTAANVATNIDALGTLAAIGDLTSITLTDGGTPTLDLTATQVGDDAGALALITSAYTVAVSDTGADVAANLDALQALATASLLSSITLTDGSTPTLSITETQLSDDSGALAAIGSSYNLAVTDVLAADAATVAAETDVTSVSVADTAANVVSNLSALETLATADTLTSIFLTDTSLPTLSITETQLSSDADALALIAGAYDLTITSVAAADAATVAATTGVTSVAISDTAANVAANLDELQALYSAGNLWTVTLTDSGTPTLSLGYAQLTEDAGALSNISGSYHIAVSGVPAGSAASVAALTNVTSVAVADTAANIVANLSALETLAGDSDLASITLADPGTPTLTVTASQLSSDATALGLISGSYGLAVTGVTAANAATVAAETNVISVSVSDTAANVASNIDSLQTVATDGLLGTIVLTDGGTPTLDITGTQFSGDSGALGAITSAYHLSVSSVLAGNAATVGANSHVTSITISDTAGNVASNIDSIESVASKLANFSLTDGGTPTMTISYTQLINDATALGKISGSFDITVTGTLAANAATAATKSHVTSILVSDTAANVVSHLSALETLATAGTLTSVSFTDSGTPTLSLTYTQFTGDTALLATFATAYDLAITSVAAANATTVAGNSHVTSISVSDTSANVASNIDALESIASQLNSIAVTDGTNTITITAAQAASDYSALSQLTGTYKIGISDTAANISSHFDALQTLYTFSGTKLTITPSDGGTNNINISATQAVNDAGAIGRLASGTFHITVTDTAANVSANFATLQGLVSPTVKLNDVVLTDGGTPTLNITYTEYNAASGTTVLGDIAGSYHVAVSAVSIAHITTVLGDAHVVSVSVSDTAANISSNLNTLQTDAAAGTVTGITVTNNTVAVSFTYTQLTSDSTALGIFTGTYSFNVTAVSYANAATVLAESHVASVNISDTAANVEAHIDALQTLFANGQLTGIVLTDGGTPSMTMTAAQGANDAGAINSISSAFHLTINDTAANVQSNLDGLETLYADIGSSDFTAITLTDGTEPTITISASQGTNDKDAINKITSAYHMTVSDTAANVVANLTGLEAINTKITTVALTDGGTPNLAITDTQYTSDLTGVINKISGSYTLTVSAVTAANATTVGGNSHVTSFTVSDTAGNIGVQFAGLQTETTAGKLTAITITSGALTTITYSQYTSGSATLALITNSSYNLSVSGVSIANSSTVLSGTHVVSVNISDTAANVQSSIDSLETLDAGGEITGIVLTDGGTPTITITATQATNDKTAIEDITSSHNLEVSDTAANVWSNIAGLVALGANLTSVVLTDGGTPNFSITGAQYSSDIGVFNKITSAYTLTVSAVAAASAATVGANSHVTSYTISDTAATVVANLTGIESHTSNLSSITLTDSGTPMLNVTGTQLNSDATAIGKITTTYDETVKADANTNESLTGTGSLNTISFTAEAQGVTANLATGTATTVHSGTTDTYTLSGFTNLTGTTSGDTLTAGSSNGLLIGDGGADTYVLNASGYDVAQDTAAHLNGCTIDNFSVLDGIDLTNIANGSATLGFVENGGGTQGVLTVSDGTHTAAITLLGNYTTASFQNASDGASGTLVDLAATTHQSAILAVAQS